MKTIERNGEHGNFDQMITEVSSDQPMIEDGNETNY